MKRILALIIAVILVIGIFSGCTTNPEEPKTDNNDVANDTTAPVDNKDPDGSYTFALVVMDLSNPFFATMVEAAKAYSEANGIELLVTDGQNDSSVQIAAMENYITMQVDGIAVMPVDGEALNDVVKQAMDAGIPVITHSNKCEASAVYACPTDRDMGLAQGEATGKWLTETFGSEDPVYYAILDYSGSPNVINRVAGMKEKIAEFCPNAVCAAQIDGYTTEMAYEAAENVMTAHPEVVALCCINDSGALGAYEAVMAMSGIDYEHFYIAGVDGTPDACKLISENSILRCSVDNAPAYFGEYFQELLKEALAGKTWTEDIDLPVTAITIDNVADFLK